MRTATKQAVDHWWARRFGVDQKVLWNASTVLPRAVPDDDPGWLVAWRGRGVHVAAPSAAEAMEVESLSAEEFPELTEAAFWEAFGHQRGLVLSGPTTHAYLDEDPGPAGAADVAEGQLAPLREAVTEEEWEEVGWDDKPTHRWGILEEGRVVAAANLGDWDGAPRDVRVLVRPDARGRGLGEAIGRHAASYAVRTYGLARWRARITDVASVRAATRLGFEPRVTALALRP